jgi:hypothetical protein
MVRPDSNAEEQRERVNRWFERIRELDSGQTEIPRSLDYYEDEFLACFQNCWHLKDWLNKNKRNRDGRACLLGSAAEGFCATR